MKSSDTIWAEHCRDTDTLKQYATAMHQLATDHWSKNQQETRIEWCRQTALEYFLQGGLKSALDKDFKRSERRKHCELMRRGQGHSTIDDSQHVIEYSCTLGDGDAASGIPVDAKSTATCTDLPGVLGIPVDAKSNATCTDLPGVSGVASDVAGIIYFDKNVSRDKHASSDELRKSDLPQGVSADVLRNLELPHCTGDESGLLVSSETSHSAAVTKNNNKKKGRRFVMHDSVDSTAESFKSM